MVKIRTCICCSGPFDATNAHRHRVCKQCNNAKLAVQREEKRRRQQTEKRMAMLCSEAPMPAAPQPLPPMTFTPRFFEQAPQMAMLEAPMRPPLPFQPLAPMSFAPRFTEQVPQNRPSLMCEPQGGSVTQGEGGWHYVPGVANNPIVHFACEVYGGGSGNKAWASALLFTLAAHSRPANFPRHAVPPLNYLMESDATFRHTALLVRSLLLNVLPKDLVLNLLTQEISLAAGKLDLSFDGPSAAPVIGAVLLQAAGANLKFRPLVVLGEADLAGKLWSTGNQPAKIQAGRAAHADGITGVIGPSGIEADDPAPPAAPATPPAASTSRGPGRHRNSPAIPPFTVQGFPSLPALLAAALHPSSTRTDLVHSLLEAPRRLASRVASCLSIASRGFVQVEVALVPTLLTQPGRIYSTGIHENRAPEAALLATMGVLTTHTAPAVRLHGKGLMLPRFHPAVGATEAADSLPLAGGGSSSSGQGQEEWVPFDLHVHVTPCHVQCDPTLLPFAVAHLLTILVVNKGAAKQGVVDVVAGGLGDEGVMVAFAGGWEQAWERHIGQVPYTTVFFNMRPLLPPHTKTLRLIMHPLNIRAFEKLTDWPTSSVQMLPTLHLVELPSLQASSTRRPLFKDDGIFRHLHTYGLGDYVVMRQGLHTQYPELFDTARQHVTALRTSNDMRTFNNRRGTYTITYRAPGVSSAALTVAADKAYGRWREGWGQMGTELGIGTHSALSSGDTPETPDWLHQLTAAAHACFVQAMREEGTSYRWVGELRPFSVSLNWQAENAGASAIGPHQDPPDYPAILSLTLCGRVTLTLKGRDVDIQPQLEPGTLYGIIGKGCHEAEHAVSAPLNEVSEGQQGRMTLLIRYVHRQLLETLDREAQVYAS